MTEKQYLINLCKFYEAFIIKKYKSLKGFYNEADCDDVIKDCFGNLNLEYCGSGACSKVYRSRECVIKLHTPYNEKITLLCNPTRKILALYKKYPYPCEETEFYPPQIKYFLFHEFVTKQGLAAVQPYAHCDEDSQIKAYNIFKRIEPSFSRMTCPNNVGMYKGLPVIIDWF